jgi:hypothetical protein
LVSLAPHWQVSDLLPIGCLIVVGDQAYHGCVISKLNDGVTVVGEQGVQEGTKLLPIFTTWWRPIRVLSLVMSFF